MTEFNTFKNALQRVYSLHESKYYYTMYINEQEKTISFKSYHETIELIFNEKGDLIKITFDTDIE